MAMARNTGTERRRAAWRALAALACTLLPATAAWAHSEVRHSTPADGAVLTAPPAEIALTFTDPMQVSALRLLDAEGRETALRRDGARTAKVASIRAAVLGGPLPPGAYRIEYRGISADGHVGGGMVRFQVIGPAPGTR